MKRALWILLFVAILLTVVSPMTNVAKADGPYGYSYSYGYVYPGTGVNRVCMYSAYNCVYRVVPPYPVSGVYYFPYNTWYRPYYGYYTPYTGYMGYSW